MNVPGRGRKTLELAALTVYTIAVFALIKIVGLVKRTLGLVKGPSANNG